MQEWFESVGKKFVMAFVEGDRWKLYIKGLGVTLEIALFAAIIGLLIGTVVALMRLSTKRDGKKTIWARIAGVYIDVIRGTPSVLQLLIMWFVIMKNCHNGILVAVLSFGINSGAYVSEIIRAGILSIDVGQMEAGRALGLTKGMTIRHIILPQALKNVFPALCNEFIVLIKETAIVGYVGLMDIQKAGDFIKSATFLAFMPLVGTAIIYYVLIKILNLFLKRIEFKLRQSDLR